MSIPAAFPEEAVNSEIGRQMSFDICRLLLWDWKFRPKGSIIPLNLIMRCGSLVYVDDECNDYMEQWNFENWGIRYWSRTAEFLQYLKEQNGK